MRRFHLRPNRNSLGLAALLVAMWYAGASQSNSAVYLLAFVFASVAAVSLVHAWVNVHGVTLAAEPITPVFEGEDLCIPLVASSIDRKKKGYPGLRVTAPGCRQMAPFDEVRADSPQRTPLWVVADQRGRFETVTVQLSTIYPLGFFTAVRPIRLAQPHYVYPKPDGNLPLPQFLEPSRQPRDGMQVEGDDFSGTRTYRTGDSQRHIDWKAAARGQPLLIKQWAGDADQIVALDWNRLGALPWEARLSQLARWIVQAEQSGATYSLALPAHPSSEASTGTDSSTVIRPGSGPAHFHECLRALATFPAEPDSRGKAEKAARAVARPAATPVLRNPHSIIHSSSLIALCLGLFLGTLPLLGRMPTWTAAVFIFSIGARLWINWKQWRLPPMAFKLIFLGISLGGIHLSHGSMLGIEPGLGILFILLSLKLLETNTVHDFQVLAMLGWFVALCGLFFSQDLRSWLYIGTVGMVLMAALIQFHRGPRSEPGNKTGATRFGALRSFFGGGIRQRGFGSSLRLTGTMLLQSLPLIILLFLFFPRGYGGYQFTFSNGITSPRAMSERMEPGSVANLALNDTPVFRVQFPDRNMPSTSQLYWRGGVLWRGDGLTWVRGNGGLRPELVFNQLAGPGIRQEIIMEPHGGRWIFALDRPATLAPKTSMEPGGYLQGYKALNKSLRYEVTSRLENREARLLPEQMRAALQKPPSISPRTQSLVDSWLSAAANERTIIESALRFFQDQNFSYTLTPGLYSGDALDEFLFERRSGFCEHYAGAFASLMRIAGVPARVVIGFHGGEFNRMGEYVIVRQSDAHAWCEVWIKGRGWLRVDPVDAIAPGRIQGGLTSFLEARSGGDAFEKGANSGNPALRLLSKLRLAWDSLNYQWDLRVLTFDEESQRTLFSFVGLDEAGWLSLLPWTGLISGLFLAALAFWIRRPAPATFDELAVREYHRFCERLAGAGLPRPLYEGAQQFTERAAVQFPLHGEAIRKIGALYIALRYAKTGPALSDFLEAVKAFGRVKLR